MSVSNWIEGDKYVTQKLKTYVDSVTGGNANANIATIETGTTASRSYVYGEYLIYQGQLCKVYTAIATGDTFTLGENISLATTIGQQIYNIHKSKICEINAANWSASAVTVDGREVYSYTLTVNNIYTTTIEGAISGATISGVPTADQETAYSKLVSFFGETDDNTITLYAKEKPSVTFYMTFTGVD